MKKKNLLYIVCALAMGSLCGCDDFLNKDPQDKQTNDTYWQTETSLRTYAQDFYSSYFTGYGTDYTVFAGYFSGDDYTDDFINLNNANTNGSGYIYFSTSATTDWNSQTGTWSGNYSVIYKANVMLEKIPGMNISDEAKKHWEGVARYFRAMAYSTLAKYYGGVPYYDKVTDPADPALYKDRDSYLYVAQKIQEDFQYALDNVRTNDTKRQVNKYVVGAYMSREMLYHATWLKYHGTTVGPTSEKVVDGDIKNLLQGAINGAEAVMNSGDMKDKIDPYLQPLYDALQDMIPAAKLKEYMELNIIQIAPLAFMRGRTLNDAVVILDEAQNTTTQQIKMFLTRMGMNTKMIVTGDMTQIDLPSSQTSGLVQALKILKGVKGISFVELNKKDIVRHKLVTQIVEAYEKFDKEAKAERERRKAEQADSKIEQKQ